MDIKTHLTLAGQNLLNCLCPRQNYLPYFNMVVSDDFKARFTFCTDTQTGKLCPSGEAHNIGRWWDAVLRLESAVGFAVPNEVESAMLTNLQRYTDHPWGLCLDPKYNRDDAKDWSPHNYRETILAFNALASFRNKQAAAERGHRVIEALAAASAKPGRWDFSPTRQPTNAEHPVTSNGRAIETLVCFYQSTGDDGALELAGRLARYHLEHAIAADGGLIEDNGDHTHSYLGTLRGLLLYGEATGQQCYIDAVNHTYHNAVLARMITPSGFTTHNICVDETAFGEPSSAGDVAQLAIWLYRHTQNPSLLDDAERFVRARLLPAQIIDTPKLTPEQQSDADEYRNLSERIVGAIGGLCGHTWGKTCVVDVTAAVTHSLIDVYQHIVTRDEYNNIRVNFHFDYSDETISISSNRNNTAKLTVKTRAEQDLFIRIPGWAPEESVVIHVNGKSAPLKRHGAFAFVPGAPGESTVELGYGLPEHSASERSRCQYFHWPERIRAGADKPFEYTLAWRGDEVVGASPVRPFFPFYPELPGSSRCT